MEKRTFWRARDVLCHQYDRMCVIEDVRLTFEGRGCLPSLCVEGMVMTYGGARKLEKSASSLPSFLLDYFCLHTLYIFPR